MDQNRLNYLAAQVKVAHAVLDSAIEQQSALASLTREANAARKTAEGALEAAQKALDDFISDKDRAIAAAPTRPLGYPAPPPPAPAMPGPPPYPREGRK